MKITLNNISIKNGDFTISADGEFKTGIHLITGRIGSGKTSLAMAMAGFLDISGGEMIKSGISSEIYSMQNPEHHVTAEKVGKEIISWGLNPEFITEKYGFESIADKDPMLLSRGELKKLELACILEKNPDVLLLDEPFSSLDCVEKKKFIKILDDRKEKITIIFTHEQAVLPKVSYIWETEDGRLIYRGKTPGAILKWKSPPKYLKSILKKGIIPANIRLEDVMEALCRMQD